MTINSYLINNSGEFFQCSSAQIRARKTHQMATRKLFDATARYLTTTRDDSDDETKKMMQSMPMKQQLHKQQSQQRANSKIKLEINKRFLASTLANCAHANRYRDANGLYRAKEKEDAVMKTPSTRKSGRKRQQQQMKTPGTKKRTRSEDQEEETNEKRRRAGGGGASTSSSSSSSSDENDDDENENDDIEDKIRKLLLLSKTKRGRGLIGARMDDVVKGDFIENENARGSTRKKSSTKKKKEKRRKKEKKREKKEKKEKRKGERGKLRGVENSS